MQTVEIGLVSADGDRIGHLVRGVQMLRSYGAECEVLTYSDVIDVVISGNEPPAGCCLLTVQSAGTLAQLHALCRQTEWALGSGDGEPALQAWVVRADGRLFDPLPRPLALMSAGTREPDMAVILPATEFAALCAWGQVSLHASTPVIGEWPGTAGE